MKTTSKIILQPMEVKTVTGFVRKNNNVDSAITEPSEQGSSAKVSVCPRIVSLNNPDKTSRVVPVRLFNFSAKVVTIQPKSSICELQEVNVLRSAPLRKKETPTTEDVRVNQQTASKQELVQTPKINLDDMKLDNEQKKAVHGFLSR